MNENNSLATRRALDKSVTLLCIDDETDNLKLLSAIFDDSYQVIGCKTAQDGYTQALINTPDLILLDVVMPDENGFELIKRIKETPELRQIPVIFITGLQSETDEEKGLTLGACDYIHKPFNNSIVKVRVNTHLEIVRQRKLLERYANIDTLTEVPNRRKWDSEANLVWSKAITTRHPLIIGIIDIDHFKQFNDCYGHLEGDAVLKKVAQCLSHTLNAVSGHLFRCGGEEFYFYIPCNERLKTQSALNKCLEEIKALKIPNKAAEPSPYLSISIGAIKITPTHKISLETVIKSADDLLYQVKHKTRNAVQFQELSHE